MKLLFLTDRVPFPPRDGISVKVFHLIRSLSRSHEIRLLSFGRAGRGDQEEWSSGSVGRCTKVTLVPGPARPVPLRSGLIGLFWPYTAYTRPYFSVAFRRELVRTLESWRPDVVHFDTLHMLGYVRYLPAGYGTFASINDSLSLAVEDEAGAAHVKPLLRVYRRAQLSAIRRMEGRLYRSFDFCHVVSQVDANHLRRLDPGCRVKVIPNGVDIDYFAPQDCSEEFPSILCFGDLSGGGSTYAIDFIGRVLPVLLHAWPGWRFFVIGGNATEQLKRASRTCANIRLTGFVPDLRPYIARASVVISPVTKRCGYLNKVAEAMAMGKAVVAWQQSLAAFDAAQNGRDLVGVSSSAEFVSAVSHLLRSPEERKRVGANARELMVRAYSWPAVAGIYESAYRDIVENSTNRR